MSRTGINRLVGGTPNDDHAIQLEVVPCTEAYTFKVTTADLDGAGGSCARDIVFVNPGDNPNTAVNYKIRNNLILTIDNDPAAWDFLIPLFYGSFEDGDLNEWDDVEP
jgi:hypothetical protein